ncbi:MAG: hypothetical protein QOG59_3303, partial [Solirubrobacteraceae bacterium]|nr:hypothetical protein [Solirubrobacteraceae bacterium]
GRACWGSQERSAQRRTRQVLKSSVRSAVTLRQMTARSPDPSADAVELGALLVLLHGADAPVDTVEVIYRLWRHRERAHAAFLADVEEQQRRGVSIASYGPGTAEAEPAESEATARIWRAGERVRVEHHGRERDGYYSVTDGPLWWIWDERNGAHSNQDDPSVGSGVGEELQFMLNPVPLLSSLRFQPTGSSEVAGRPTISAHGIPRPRDTARHGPAFELHELGTGADFYELEVDRQLGVLLVVTAVRDGQPFHRITTLAVAFDQLIPDETFRFEPPAGEQIQSQWGEERLEHVTLVEAQQRAPFTVLMPDRVPANWQVQCRLIRPSERPPSPMQIGLIYSSTDGHESISLSQFPAGGSNAYRELGDGEGWETVTRGGIEMKTRPARWGQAQVELERDGTFVHLMSDNLTRDQVLTIAAGLRPAPSTSSI